MIVSIYIENERLELFEDENISVTSSVLDIQDISKNTTDYSNAFTVPASEVNNKIFKHYYNANIDNTFDARVSVDGRIEIGGILFRNGKILLQKVNVKSGVPDNYTINFWGNLVSLKDVLGDDKLADLDLSAYDHDYDGITVLSGLDEGPPYQDYIYTLLVKKRLYYNSNASDVTMTDTEANIHYQSGTPNGVRFDDLRPGLALYRIIQAIETDYGLTFSNDFWGRDEFKRLYLWLNNSESGKPGDTSVVDFKTGATIYIDLNTDIGTFVSFGYPFQAGADWFDLRTTITPSSGFESVQYTINVYSGSSLISSSTGAGTMFIDNALNSTSAAGFSVTHEIHWELQSDGYLEYTVDCAQTTNGVSSITTSGSGSVGSVFKISDNIPDLKIIDFLKGLFNAFKLVVIPENDGTLYVNTVENYYTQGEIIDVTNYVDVESVDVSRGNILNEISYNFEEPQTILNEQFKENNFLAYGDEDAQIRDESGNLLDGDSLDIDVPFEQIVYERLHDTNGVDTIELMFGQVTDKNNNPVNPKAHIFYSQIYTVGGDGIGFIDELGNKLQIGGKINTATHVIDDLAPSHAFIFSEEFNNFNGALISNNLFTNYHQTYINNLFNVKRRNFTWRTKILPVPILLELSLNDVLKIGHNYYRIDKFTTDLTSGKTELNLVNSFENTLISFTSEDIYILLSSLAQSHSSYVNNLTTYTVNKVDLGDGVGWISVSDSGSYIVFTVTENTTAFRNVQVDITDDVSGTTIPFYIGQSPELIGADITPITADTTTITADNDKNFLVPIAVTDIDILNDSEDAGTKVWSVQINAINIPGASFPVLDGDSDLDGYTPLTGFQNFLVEVETTTGTGTINVSGTDEPPGAGANSVEISTQGVGRFDFSLGSIQCTPGTYHVTVTITD